MNQVCLNGKLYPADEPVLMAGNRSYRYGDGLFETMKLVDGIIIHVSYHFERLLSGLTITNYIVPDQFNSQQLQQEILHLCTRNECLDLARVRLSVFRGNGGLYDDDNDLQYLIEAWPLNKSVNNWNEKGLVIGIHEDVRKSTDKFSNLKSANFLPYSLAAAYAKQKRWDDSIVLNTNNRICDATTANIFAIKGDILQTPPLDEGCVAGIMRKIILRDQHLFAGLIGQVKETTLTPTDLADADEIFLTNAIYGIRWVSRYMNQSFGHKLSGEINKRLFEDVAS